MVESNNKKLWLALGAFGALCGAAYLYHLATSGDDDGDDAATPGSIKAAIEEANLAEVQRDGAQGTLQQQYFLRLLQFIGEQNKARTAAQREKSTRQRRIHYEKQEWDQYERVVTESFQQEDQSAQQLMQEICDVLGVTQMEFQHTHQSMVADPRCTEQVMAAQQGKFTPPDLKKKATLSKQKTLQIFKITQEASKEVMGKLKELEQAPGNEQEKMMKFMIEQIKLQDKVFFETKTENEEFEESLMIYMRTDPAVQKEMQDYMMKMQMEMQKQAMGR